MKDEPLYLTKNAHGVYYYRRPISGEDQTFWRGPSGSPKKEWNKSLRTKDRREAIERMVDAADMYEAERETQLAHAHAQSAPVEAQESETEREERLAAEAALSAKVARREARSELRIERRRRIQMSTAELSPEEAAWHDLVSERDAELAELRAAVAGQRERNAVLAGRPCVTGPTSDSRSVDALLSAYEADKSPGWSGSSKKAIVPVFRVLREVFPDRAADSITRQEARELVALLERLPTQIGKRRGFVGLSVREAVEKNAKLGYPTISPKTINDGYLLHVSSVFNWAMREGLATGNPFKGLSVHDPVDDAERRDPFTSEQLTVLFSQGPWKQPWKTGGDKAGAYWVPLLCLFHGLRNGEAAGLRTRDIGEQDGIPLFHIKAYEGRALKNTGAAGTMPIHSELLSLGFLRYVEERKKAGEELLFPEGTANNRGQVGAKLAERFSKMVKQLGFEGRKLGMHSFRHNFEDRLRAAELPERTALALARRKEAGSSSVYGSGLSIGQKRAALEKIEYVELNLNHLRGD